MEPHQICKDNNILAIIMSTMAYNNNNINTFSHSNNSTTSRHPPTSNNHFRPLPWPRQWQPCKGSQPPSTSRPCRPPAAVAAVAHRRPLAALAEVTAGPVPTTSPAVTKVRSFKLQQRLRCSRERPLRPAAVAPTLETQIRGAGLNI